MPSCHTPSQQGPQQGRLPGSSSWSPRPPQPVSRTVRPRTGGMDFVDRLSNAFGGTRRGFSMESVLKFQELSPRAQAQLGKVYLTLAGALAVASAGAAFNMYTGLGGLLAVLGFMVAVPWLLATPAVPSTLHKRQALLGAAAFSQGALLGPLVGAAVQINPSVLLVALLGTSAVFACFSAAALMSKRRSFLYLGGILSSVMSTFLLMRLATWFLGGAALLFEAELYVGLLAFLGYILFDTQMIVERLEAGDTDTVRAALDLFVDFAAVFARLLVIMLRNAERREREGREERAKRRRR